MMTMKAYGEDVFFSKDNKNSVFADNIKYLPRRYFIL